MQPVPAVLSIAGSDSGGGAGIQADLKAFARCGVHGMTAITALTAQSTVGVSAIHSVPGEFIVEQVRAVVEDIEVAAVKIGMLGTAAAVAAVASALDLLDPGTPIVIDPVMVAESGAVLLDAGARTALTELLLARATVITPNLPEARVLTGAGVDSRSTHPAGTTAGRGGDDAVALARSLHQLGPSVVVVTGGHRDQATDVLFDGAQVHLLAGPRHPDGAAHGSGCTHSSVLAAQLALGLPPLQAARVAKRIAAEAVRQGLHGIGRGAGPVDVLGLAAQQARGLPDGATPRV